MKLIIISLLFFTAINSFSVLYTPIYKEYGGAPFFDATNDQILFKDADFDWIEYGQPFTIMFWCRIGNTTGNGTAIGKRTWPLGWDIQPSGAATTNHRIKMIFAKDGSNYYQPIWELAVLEPIAGVSDWHNIAVVYNGGNFTTRNISLYVDSIDQKGETGNDGNAGTVNTIINNYDMKIGNNGDNEWFGGEIDNVAFFDCALSTQQVSGFMYSSPVGCPNLKAYYNFDSYSQTGRVSDLSGNNKHSYSTAVTTEVKGFRRGKIK